MDVTASQPTAFVSGGDFWGLKGTFPGLHANRNFHADICIQPAAYRAVSYFQDTKTLHPKIQYTGKSCVKTLHSHRGSLFRVDLPATGVTCHEPALRRIFAGAAICQVSVFIIGLCHLVWYGYNILVCRVKKDMGIR